MFKNKNGFIMVELMVVLIIIAIPAVAAIPLYQANIKRAIRAEAEATLGAIRSAERIYKLEFGGYTLHGLNYVQVKTVLGVNVEDAYYFDENCYDVTAPNKDNGTTFTARCRSNNSNTAPGAAKTQEYFGKDNSIVLMMNEKGVITTEY